MDEWVVLVSDSKTFTCAMLDVTIDTFRCGEHYYYTKHKPFEVALVFLRSQSSRALARESVTSFVVLRDQ